MLDDTLSKIFPGSPDYISAIAIDYKRKIDESLINKIIEFISSSVNLLSDISLKKIVIGLSGGIDSVVMTILAQRVFKENVSVIIVDFGKEKYSDETIFSIAIAKQIGTRYTVVKGGKLQESHFLITGEDNTLVRLHLRTRIINNIIFQIADSQSASVIDTTDKSERLLGRHAEDFYGHFAPLTDLYKTEVYDLARFLSPTIDLSKQPGCPELKDRDAFGVDWEILDPIIYLLVEKKLSVQEIADLYKIDKLWLSKIKKRIEKQHYRTETKKMFLDSK